MRGFAAVVHIEPSTDERFREVDGETNRRGSLDAKMRLESNRHHMFVAGEVIRETVVVVVATDCSPMSFERDKHVSAFPIPMKMIHERIQRMTRRPFSGIAVICRRRQPKVESDS